MIDIILLLAVHNRKQLTFNFLKSITTQSFPNERFKIIVVDDGSTDGTSEMIEELYKDVILLKGDGSLFWTASTNLAIKYALDNFDPKFFITVNDDTEVDYYFTEELYAAAINNSKSIIGCFSYDIDDKKKLLYDGSVVNWFTGRICELNSNCKDNIDKLYIPLTYYIGRGVLIPSDVYKEHGLYDAVNFPQSWADNELVFRAKFHGYKVLSAPKAVQYIYNNESPHLKLKKDKSVNNFLNYLFIQKGGGNIISYSKYVIKSYPFWGVPLSLLFGILSRVIGYWK
jgi:GT2 family glycosyltransferase